MQSTFYYRKPILEIRNKCERADVTTLIPVIERLRCRFSIARVCVVADRGMISAETVAELAAPRLLYLLGVRERTDRVVIWCSPIPRRSCRLDHQARL